MDAALDNLRKEAARILRQGIVDGVIGFTAGTLPYKSRPVLLRRATDAHTLVMDGLGPNNLAVYLTRRSPDERLGVVCRGCESRSVRALVLEKQLDRERLYVIGIPCRGILDEGKLLSAAGQEIRWIRETDDKVTIGTPTGEVRSGRTQLLHCSCRQCRYPDPIGVDTTIGATPATPPPAAAGRPCIDPLANRTADERHGFFQAEVQHCIRCYACRQACPMCYCTQCFVDHAAPRWIDSTVAPAGTQTWHLIRAFHQTGRCVSCGACERACPMAIRMTYLTDQLNRDMEETYGFIPGLDENMDPPFGAFSAEDSDLFEP